MFLFLCRLDVNSNVRRLMYELFLDEKFCVITSLLVYHWEMRLPNQYMLDRNNNSILIKFYATSYRKFLFHLPETDYYR